MSTYSKVRHYYTSCWNIFIDCHCRHYWVKWTSLRCGRYVFIFFSDYLVVSDLSYSVHLFYCMCLSLSIESLLTLPFTLKGDRWWIARTFDSGSIQQELHWPSCKPLSYIYLSAMYSYAADRSCSFVFGHAFTASTLFRGTTAVTLLYDWIVIIKCLLHRMFLFYLLY